MAKNKKLSTTGTLPMLIGAIGFGIAAALLSVLYLKAKEASIRKALEGKEQQMVAVVVANQNLPRGAAVMDGNFAILEIPVDFVHEDAVYPSEYGRYQGRALTTALGVGKPLLKSFLDEDFPVDFSDTIPVGRRAMTITVDEVNSIAGQIRPGNRIDLFVNIPYAESGFNPKFYTVGLFSELPPGLDAAAIPGGINGILGQSDELADELLNYLSPGDVILPVLQNIRVLATGKDPYIESLDKLRQPQFRTDTNFGNMTLDLSPEEAALLTAAQDKGDMLAVLRNRKDEGLSSFTTISARDLFQNAQEMAIAQKEQASRATVAGGVDINGNLVDANGKKLMSREQLAAAGLTVNENGQLVDKDGNIIDPKDVVIGPNGKVMTKQQLAAAGFTVNESGQIIDKNGNVVSAEDIVVAADGTIMTKQQLAAAGLTVNEKGEIVDNKGRIVSPDDVIVSKDGKVMTKQQLAAAGMSAASGMDSNGNLIGADGKVLANREQLEAAGYTINENGEIIDKDGNVVDPASLVVDKNGKVMSADNVNVAADGSVLSEEQLAAAGLTVNKDGQLVDKDGNIVDPKDVIVGSDGTVMTKQQLEKAGLSINENGQIIDKNGNVVDPNDLITGPDGQVLSKKQLQQAGLKVNAEGKIVDASGKEVDSEQLAKVASSIPITGSGIVSNTYEMIIGGKSEDGVAKAAKVTVQSDK